MRFLPVGRTCDNSVWSVGKVKEETCYLVAAFRRHVGLYNSGLVVVSRYTRCVRHAVLEYITVPLEGAKEQFNQVCDQQPHDRTDDLSKASGGDLMALEAVRGDASTKRLVK